MLDSYKLSSVKLQLQRADRLTTDGMLSWVVYILIYQKPLGFRTYRPRLSGILTGRPRFFFGGSTVEGFSSSSSSSSITGAGATTTSAMVDSICAEPDSSKTETSATSIAEEELDSAAADAAIPSIELVLEAVNFEGQQGGVDRDFDIQFP